MMMMIGSGKAHISWIFTLIPRLLSRKLVIFLDPKSTHTVAFDLQNKWPPILLGQWKAKGSLGYGILKLFGNELYRGKIFCTLKIGIYVRTKLLNIIF